MERKTHLFDAKGKVLGRIATDVALVLSGKKKVDFTPHIDAGDSVVIINAEKVAITGNKLEGKIYHRFSGYPGGITSIALKDLLAKDPAKVFKNAVNGMLPKNKLRDRMMKRLHVVTGSEHQYKIDVTH
ncbi:MAG: 50S ribosomal protein L13 [Candidatus Moranbacteria bacterium GW2011_GWE1_49_15]|nr:MAG: 50S ribosomal protein L13 [Candidatus Moranbacteria bacterium GW2011_GWE2_47_10]KKW07594.1 MAG: 50S ribosomal protein L13 [Candidatus Moranbacteria bacterium GW2011_GWE1_49_15]HBP01072.1 50S ribosomal protein L13 [Candidatus Moranbacteria bacterium]